jgi:hypothetical protein
MNHRDRFLQIKDFLKPYQRIWENEIMLMYPDPFASYSMEWIQELRKIQDKNDVIRLEKKDVFGLIQNPELLTFYHKIEELSGLPQVEKHPAMPEEPWTWLYVTPKKQHEIKNLAPHLNHLYLDKKIDQVMDIGGGIGILAQTLNNQYEHKVISIDMNAQFQKTGIERHENNAKNPLNKVQYKNIKVDTNGEFSKLLQSNVMPVGLHTCGKLALDIIRQGSEKKVPALVNFGCCYHTLDLSADLQNISHFAQTHNPLWMNKFSLVLSCRAHRKMDEKDYDFKVKVKYFRYAFHILLHDHYDIKKLVTLGNSPAKLYDETFGDYAREQFRRLDLSPKHTVAELNEIFAQTEMVEMIENMLAAGFIRNALGRVMELYLLLDRVIFLEEQGYDVRIEEFFDEELSPRNIGITAVLRGEA